MDHNETAVLAALVDQARLQGTNTATLKALVEEASEVGARRALHHVGLADQHAGEDVRALRDLLDAWRSARRTAWHTIIRWLITCLIFAVVAGLSVKLKLWPPAG